MDNRWSLAGSLALADQEGQAYVCTRDGKEYMPLFAPDRSYFIAAYRNDAGKWTPATLGPVRERQIIEHFQESREQV